MKQPSGNVFDPCAAPTATATGQDEMDTEISIVRDMRGQVLPGKRTSASVPVLQEENKRNRPAKLPEHNDTQALETLESTETVVVGVDALRLRNDNNEYQLRQPLASNGFATYPRESDTAVHEDFACFMRAVLQTEFSISDENISQFKAIIILPDTCSRRTIKIFLELLLNSIGFAAVLVHHTSVCATFGAGVNLACVVDVGHTGFNVSCVQDGMSLRESRIYQPFGGLAVEQVLDRELQGVGVPFAASLDINDVYQETALRQYKEKYCRLDLDDIKRQKTVLAVRRPGHATMEYSIVVDKELGRAPLALFYPGYCCDRTDQVLVGCEDSYVDAEDAVFEDNKGDLRCTRFLRWSHT
jgi:actin-related protein 8